MSSQRMLVAGCVSILMEELEMEVLFKKKKKTLDVINRITGNA